MGIDKNGIVVVGAGQAGAELVAALRMSDYRGPITMVGDEAFPPYYRPPLSKAYLSGKVDLEGLYIRPVATYEEQGIAMRVSTRVVAVDRDAHRILLEDGSSLGYERLVLATGGRVRKLQYPGLDVAPNVHYLRTIDDINAMRHRFLSGARLVIIGGGYVGLEVASVARQLGLSVTVLEAQPRVLARVTASEVSSFYQRIHAEEGVDVRVDTTVAGFGFAADGAVASIELGSGESISADVVLIGIGQVPNVELAEAAALTVENGIVVDEYCRTADPDILAIGDCTSHPCSENGGRRRLESAPNASEQARVAAATLTGTLQPYNAIPWFWSDQYGTKLQTVGLSAGYDDVVIRGETEKGRSFVAFYLKNGEIRAADVVSSPRDFMFAKKLVAQRAKVSRATLEDLSIPLKQSL